MPDNAFQADIQFRVHPRVFAALGADLVTNDIVAVLELVKNSYDALATRVDVAFREEKGVGRILEVTDNGTGMGLETIRDVWCVVATPYRREHPIAMKGKQSRRASGDKGLGRLSTARLGEKLEMLTKTAGGPCWLVKVDWSKLTKQKTLGACIATYQQFDGKTPFHGTGTRVRVLELRSDWGEDQMADLEDNLARLISPFSKAEDFAIHLVSPKTDREVTSTRIFAPEFLQHPPYAIRGHVTPEGDVKARYEYSPISQGSPRKLPLSIDWADIEGQSHSREDAAHVGASCGPFEFEIRAWDIGGEDTSGIAERYDIAKGNVRKAIQSHKGISVYRDGVLVLPKSEESRDWLGLDLRRVSRVGPRLSTSQIVGYVSITAERNPGLEDTSDREGLARNRSVLDFQQILRAVVSSLEQQRNEDRLKPGSEQRLESLLAEVSGREFVEEIGDIAKEGGSAADALVRAQDFSAKLDRVRDSLNTRLAYYSRLATVGTIAQILVHEIRNRTTAIGRFLRLAKEINEGSGNVGEFPTRYASAEASVSSLERLADTFAPLASRSFRRGRREAVLEESLSRCVALLGGEITAAKVRVEKLPTTKTVVAVDPGELDAIILNLLTNALYWLAKGDRNPRLQISVARGKSGRRAKLTISDSGPGVSEADAEKIFLPGVTRKPGGIGMGLTVAAELVAEYGGKLVLARPGSLGGATFAFDVPLKS